MRYLKGLTRTRLLLCLALLSSVGCRIITGTLFVGAAVVGVAGYTVYQGGRLVVVSAGSAVSAGADGVQSIVFSGGNLQTEFPKPVEPVYNAAFFVFHEMRFTKIKGRQDSLSGTLEAQTVQNETVVLDLKLLENRNTSMNLKIGRRGNLKHSQVIFDKIIDVLNERKAA